jgi:hypothetical protein
MEAPSRVPDSGEASEDAQMTTSPDGLIHYWQRNNLTALGLMGKRTNEAPSPGFVFSREESQPRSAGAFGEYLTSDFGNDGQLVGWTIIGGRLDDQRTPRRRFTTRIAAARQAPARSAGCPALRRSQTRD